MEVVKIAVAGALFGVLATIVGDAAAEIMAYGGAAIVIGAVWRKVIRPLIALSELLGGLPAWMKTHDERIERGDAKFSAIEGRLRAVEQHAGLAAEASTALARDLDVHHRGEPPAPL